MQCFSNRFIYSLVFVMNDPHCLHTWTWWVMERETRSRFWAAACPERESVACGKVFHFSLEGSELGAAAVSQRDFIRNNSCLGLRFGFYKKQKLAEF